MQYTTYYDSPVGKLEISGNDQSVESILFVETQKRPSPQHPATAETSVVMQQCIKELDEYFAGNRQTFDFAYTQEGTAFQQSVWKELEHISFGKTISYLELSRRLQNEKAIRAVGVANGLNHLSIVVPCHRVIGADGSLVGYGGDLWRKKWLLDHEAKIVGNYQMSLF